MPNALGLPYITEQAIRDYINGATPHMTRADAIKCVCIDRQLDSKNRHEFNAIFHEAQQLLTNERTRNRA